MKAASSRGPEPTGADTLSAGGLAVEAVDAVADVVILSIPPSRTSDVTPLFTDVPTETVVIDTVIFYPLRDSPIKAIEDEQIETLWITGQLGCSVVKAWNAIGLDSFVRTSKPAGDPERIANPVAADKDSDRRLGRSFVEDTELDAVDAWPTSPVTAPAARLTGVLHGRHPRADAWWPGRSGRGAITKATRPGVGGRRGEVRPHDRP